MSIRSRMNIKSVVYSGNIWQTATWIKPISIMLSKEARHKVICNTRYVYIMFKAALNYRVSNQDNVCLPLMKGRNGTGREHGDSVALEIFYILSWVVVTLVCAFISFIVYAFFCKYIALWFKNNNNKEQHSGNHAHFF